MELEKSCAICDSTSKGVAVACCQSRAIFNNVVFFAVVFQQTPPTAFVRSASKFFSKLTRCHLRKVGVQSKLVPWSFFQSL